jgi:peptidylprolyl isomerase
VKVAGGFLKTPKVTMPTPLKASGFQRPVLIKGSGGMTAPTDTVDVALAAYNGVTGKALTIQGFGNQPALVTGVGTVVPGVEKTIDCVRVGSRVVLTSSVENAFGGEAPAQWKMKKTDAIVFVADVTKILPERANGAVQHDIPKGMPTVTLAKSGQPTVTIPKTDPPKKTTVVDLRKGDGTTVKSGDLVTLQYQGVNWRTGKVFDQSWGRGLQSLQTDQVVSGFRKALEGQKVGSQVLVTIPPADGYGKAGNKQADIKGTDTLVFVIDIIQTLHK